MRSKQAEVQAAEEQVVRLEAGIKEAKAATDKVQKEYNALSEKVRGGRGKTWRADWGVVKPVPFRNMVRQQTHAGKACVASLHQIRGQSFLPCPHTAPASIGGEVAP